MSDFTISQAAVEAVRKALSDEGALPVNSNGEEHYPGYWNAIAEGVLEAALPHLRTMIAEEIEAWAWRSENARATAIDAAYWLRGAS